MSQNQAVRFGVIGLRRGESLARACQTLGDAEVSALYDIDAGKVDALARTLGATPYTDLDAFLGSDIDVAVVASPIPFHAEQSIAALEAGKHVISEVLPCTSVDEAKALVAAVRASGRQFMVAENCIYYDDIELVKRLNDQGRLGHVYYAEGDYVHDCTGSWFDPDGNLTWRGRGELGVYGTHGLGPLLYITGDRVAEVHAVTSPSGLVDPRVPFPTMYILEMATEGGRRFRSRVDIISPRPLTSTTSFVVQGTDGVYESAKSTTDVDRIWLRDRHETTQRGGAASWHPIRELVDEVIPDRANATEVVGGHGTAEYWMLRAWMEAYRSGADMPIDIYRGLDLTLPLILAVDSAANGGDPIPVPDPRTW